LIRRWSDFLICGAIGLLIGLMLGWLITRGPDTHADTLKEPKCDCRTLMDQAVSTMTENSRLRAEVKAIKNGYCKREEPQ